MKLIISNFIEVIKNETKESREALAKAANLSGKAINISKTTACHSISYPITSNFNVSHGQAVALTLGSILVYNSEVTPEDSNDERGFQYVRKTIQEISQIICSSNSLNAKDHLSELMKKSGLKTKLSELGIITDNDIEIIIKNGFNPQRVKNNPRKLTEEALRKIIQKIR